MNTENRIEITGCDLVNFVKHVYAMSAPVGLGYMHFQNGELPDDIAESLCLKALSEESFSEYEKQFGRIIVNMDYVLGRCCKMYVTEFDGKWFINNNWYDHTDQQLDDLLKLIGVDLSRV